MTSPHLVSDDRAILQARERQLENAKASATLKFALWIERPCPMTRRDLDAALHGVECEHWSHQEHRLAHLEAASRALPYPKPDFGRDTYPAPGTYATTNPGSWPQVAAGAIPGRRNPAPVMPERGERNLPRYPHNPELTDGDGA